MMTRQQLSLDGAWQLQVDPFNAGEAAGYARVETDTRGWRNVQLPAGFDHCAPELTTYEGYGWFRRVFTVPADWQGREMTLHFGAVNFQADVWLNGHHLGESVDAFLPFAFQADEWLHLGAENVLVVRVNAARRPGAVPGPEHGWRPIGGILREVALSARDARHLDAVRLTAEANGCWHLQATAVLDTPGTCRLTILNADGHPCAEVEAAVDGQSEVVLQGQLADVHPWHPETPECYTAEVALEIAGTLVDTVDLRFGFRTVAVRDGQLLLNDRPITLRGFNRHEDSPHTGMAVDLATARADFQAMQAAGANFVRLAHYPHHPGELDLCDELGLLVMDEIPVYWWTGLDEGEACYHDKLATAKRQLQTLLARDAHHPSVIFWSVSNETREHRPGVVEGNDALIAHVKVLDPTRLVVHVADESVWTDTPHFPHDDVICINGYPSWFKGMEAGNPDYDPAEATHYWETQLAKLHAMYPDKPIFITEFGYPCLAGFGDGPLGEETQARYLAAEFAGMAAPYVCGTLLWCYADHPWPEIGAICNLTTSPFGVVTRTRKEKRAYRIIQRLFGGGRRG